MINVDYLASQKPNIVRIDIYNGARIVVTLKIFIDINFTSQAVARQNVDRKLSTVAVSDDEGFSLRVLPHTHGKGNEVGG